MIVIRRFSIRVFSPTNLLLNHSQAFLDVSGLSGIGFVYSVVGNNADRDNNKAYS